MSFLAEGECREWQWDCCYSGVVADAGQPSGRRWFNNWQLVPGRIERHSGTIRCSIYPGDPKVNGGHRAELYKSLPSLKYGGEHTLLLDFMPRAWGNEVEDLSVFDFHWDAAPGLMSSPNLYVQCGLPWSPMEGPYWHLVVRRNVNGARVDTPVASWPLVTDQWMRLEMSFCLHPETGWCIVRADGQERGRYVGGTCYAMTESPHCKVGIYKYSPWADGVVKRELAIGRCVLS